MPMPNDAPWSPPPALASLGLRPVGQTLRRRRRLLISTVGWQKCGKTDFGLSAPKSRRHPLLALDYDVGMEELLDSPRFADAVRQDLIIRQDMRHPWHLEPSGALTNDTVAAAMVNVEKFKKLYSESVKSGAFKSIFIDNGYALLQAFRAARLGKNMSIFGGVDARQYGPVNTEFEEVLKQALDHDTNVIISHRYEDRFAMDKKADAETGEVEKFKLKGYKDIKYVTQVHLEHLKDYKTRDLRVRIVECRQNNRAEGREFPVEFLDEETCELAGAPAGSSVGGTFLDIALAVCPATTAAEWLED